MKNLEKIYTENNIKVYTELENDYLNKKEISRDINRLLSNTFNELDKKRIEYPKSFSEFNLDTLKLEFENIRKDDKRITLNEALNLVTKNNKGLQNKIVQALSTSNALNEFNTFLRSEDNLINSKGETIEQKQRIEIKWTNGTNKNNFVKIIYAIHKAGLINSGNGEITKIVEQLAEAFNVELSNNWQSNFSKNKNDRNLDYNSLAIFDTLKDSYSKYLKDKNNK